MPALYLIVGALLEVAGDIGVKRWALSPGQSTKWLWVGAALYLAGSLFWILALRSSPLSRAIVIFTVLNVLMATVVGVVLFGESMTTKLWIGLLLGLTSVAVLETE
jgi:multidrug transporter EmrE-like cation transporter